MKVLYADPRILMSLARPNRLTLYKLDNYTSTINWLLDVPYPLDVASNSRLGSKEEDDVL
jgi:hypothetical protein